jgi:hypothetical protein
VIELYEDARTGALVLHRPSDGLTLTRLGVSGSSFAADALALESGQTLDWMTAKSDATELGHIPLIARWRDGAIEVVGQPSSVAARYLAADELAEE